MVADCYCDSNLFRGILSAYLLENKPTLPALWQKGGPFFRGITDPPLSPMSHISHVRKFSWLYSPLPESHHHSSPWLLWSTPGRTSIVPGWSPCSKAPCMWPEGPSPPAHPFWPHWLPCQHGLKSQARSCLRAFALSCFCCLGCFSHRDSFTALKSVLDQQHCAGLRAEDGSHTAWAQVPFLLLASCRTSVLSSVKWGYYWHWLTGLQ